MAMGRVIIGALVATLVMFILGALFYATPLRGMGQGNLPDQQAAEVQRSLAANLPQTGTYIVPDASTDAQTVMYGQGPIATIHYNTGGFASFDSSAMLGGLILYLVIALLMAGSLYAVERQVHDFASRARVVVGLVLMASAYIHLKMPIFYHHDWGHAIYAFIADAVTLGIGGLIIARFFLPRHSAAAPAEAPSEV
jgi:hypothetical protein